MLSTEDLVNGGIIAAAVLAILLVALSTYGRRRRHPVVRFLVWGASVVFLPLTSSIISSLLDRSTKPNCDGTMPPSGRQNPNIQNKWTILLWIVLMLTIKCNADVAAAAVTAAAASPVASDVNGQTVRPPLELVAQYAWVAFLIWLCVPLAGWLGRFNIAIFIAFTALGLAKVVINLGAFWKASDSFALGNNARLVDGYTAELAGDGRREVPRYIVTGEKKTHFEENAEGYRVKRDVLGGEPRSSSLVTLDRVWWLAEHGARDGILAEPKRKLRDLCLSYSLFKMLRRRLSGHPLADAAWSRESLSFVLRGMDSAGAAGANADRVFRVVADALSFASDFYYSPIPLCAVGGWWAALNYLCSVLIIVGAIVVGLIYDAKGVVRSTPNKVITYSLLLAVVLVEAWEIVAGVCSNWTKVALLGPYIRHEQAWRRQWRRKD